MNSDRRTTERKSTTDYFLLYETETGELIGRLLDLTVDGLLFMNESELDMDRTISCTLSFPRIIGNRRFIYFDIETKWCKYNKHCDWYEIGCQMLDLKDKDRLLLDEIIIDWNSKQERRINRPESG